jgi:hypothetical protein
VGFSRVLLLPSPKLQLHDAGDPVDASINVTERGADPDVGEAEKTGNGMVVAAAAVVGNVTIKASVLPVPVPTTVPAAAVPLLTVGVNAVEKVQPDSEVSTTIAV